MLSALIFVSLQALVPDVEAAKREAAAAARESDIADRQVVCTPRECRLGHLPRHWPISWPIAEAAESLESTTSALVLECNAGGHEPTWSGLRLRVAAEAQRTADELGPAAESALGAADAAVKAARLGAVKLRAQVRTRSCHRPCAGQMRDAARRDAHRNEQLCGWAALWRCHSFASARICPSCNQLWSCQPHQERQCRPITALQSHGHDRTQDVELSPADLHALAAAQLDAWRAAHSNAEGFEVRDLRHSPVHGCALYSQAVAEHAQPRCTTDPSPFSHPDKAREISLTAGCIENCVCLPAGQSRAF